MTRALVKKMLHGQIKLMRDAAKRGDGPTLEVLSQLWDDE